MNIPVVGGDGWDSPKLAEIAGAAALNKTYFTNHYSADSDSKESKALAVTKNFKAVTGNTSLNEKHDAVMSAVIIEFKDGKQAYRATINP